MTIANRNNMKATIHNIFFITPDPLLFGDYCLTLRILPVK